MMHKDKLLLPVMLAAALAAGPVLAQSTGTPGSTTGTDSRPGTAQGTTGGSGSATTGPSVGTGPGMGRGMGMAAGAMHGWPADSVVMFRPRLSQLIGANVYNDRNEAIGEVDDILLAGPTGAGTTSTAPRPATGAMTPGTTIPGSATPGSTMGTATPSTATPSTAMPSTATPGTTTPGTTTQGMTGSTTTPGTSATMPGMSATDMQRGPMAVIQVGGFLGMGGRLVMVPLSELQWNAERERVVLPNATKELLQGRPAFTYDLLRRG